MNAFHKGERVRVIRGEGRNDQYNGSTGTVVRLRGQTAVVELDNGGKATLHPWECCMTTTKRERRIA